MKSPWWKSAVVYQIYPRSFYDSNGDGVGDLPGIIQKLDYLESLGVDAVWLNPIFKSPYDDGGYDISDYRAIHEEFGNMHDFDALLTGLHSRGIKLIIDVVLNHSSDEHTWFIESRKDTTNSYRDYYFWRKGKGSEPPNNWPSFFGGSAWQLDTATGEYYLHLFSRKQPDLNWENPALRDELAAIMEFWLQKGVDGLRLDVISAISKQPDFPDTDTPDFNETIRKYYANGPRLKEFIAEMRQRVWDKHTCMTVGEGPGITPQNALDYLDAERGLNMIFHFGHMFMDQGPGGRFDPIPWTLKDFKQVFVTWNEALEKQGWGSVFLGNHDFARMVSRWGNDGAHWRNSATLLLTLMLTQRGTPFVYAGDEIGMTNLTLDSITASKDIETLNGWREAQARGVSEADFLKIANYSGRDNARSPFQWSGASHAGFTSGQPWMQVNPNCATLNVSAQEPDERSVLNYFRALVRFRKRHAVLSEGTYEPCTHERQEIFAYARLSDQEKLLVVMNFSNQPLTLEASWLPPSAQWVFGNEPPPRQLVWQPWQVAIYNV
jgi:oligo-1,6-glucosidase